MKEEGWKGQNEIERESVIDKEDGKRERGTTEGVREEET